MLAWFHVVGIKLGAVDVGYFGVRIYGIKRGYKWYYLATGLKIFLENLKIN